MAKEKKNYSGIGGQAVMEGIMMKNKDRYSVAVRKSDGTIEVMEDTYKSIGGDNPVVKLPFIRGIFAFVDSLVLGMKTLSWSASFIELEEEESSAEVSKKVSGEKPDEAAASEGDKKQAGDDKTNQNEKAEGEKENSLPGWMLALTVAFSIVMAIGIFMLLPYFITEFFRGLGASDKLLAVMEGVLRILIFVLYVGLISLMQDIKRVYMYHGAEHKCINCIENGMELKVENVMASSRLHTRCGTSFMLFVMFVSILLFMLIRTDNPGLRLLFRILLIPVISGISYEIIRLAGKSSNIIVRLISAPGLCLQKITTREPDEAMVEVAISAVEKVFDWREYLKENF